MKLLLKIYFWVYAFILVFIIPIALLSLSIVDYAWLVVILLTFFGLQRYIFTKTSGNTTAWKVSFYASMAYYAIFAFYLDKQYGSMPPESTGDYLLTLLTPLPAFIATYLFIRRRPRAS